MENKADPQDLHSSIFSSNQPIVLGNHHLLILAMVCLSLMPHASLFPFGLICCDMVSFCCISTITQLRRSKHQLLMNIAYSLIVQVPSNAMLIIYFTIVPKAEVIISASGLRDKPKSATLAAHLLFFFTINTFNDFKCL